MGAGISFVPIKIPLTKRIIVQSEGRFCNVIFARRNCTTKRQKKKKKKQKI